MAALQKAIETDPNYVEPYVNLALILAGQGRFPEAEQQARTAVQLGPRNIEALKTLSMIRVRLGRNAEAVAGFRQLVALGPKSAEAHLNLGIALADGLDLSHALDEFSEAVRLDPKSPMTHFNRGRALGDLRRYEEAKMELETALRIAPDSVPILYRLALTEKQLDHADRSAELLRRVVAADPGNADAHYLLGQNLAKAGQNSEAVTQWKRAVEINPEHGEALYNLFRALQSSEYQDRFTALQQRRQIADRAETLNNFALAAAAAQDAPRAIEQLKEALEVCRECRSRGDLHKNLGLIYVRAGDLTEGERELRAALSLKPQDADVRRALEMIETLRKQSAQQ